MEFKHSVWLRRLLTWHWVSSALVLFGMLLFAVTGITLNHAEQISTQPEVRTLEARLPAALTAALQAQAQQAPSAVPVELRQWLQGQAIEPGHAQPEWDQHELYLSMPRPGGDAWLSIDLASGQLHYEATDRGWVAYLNDLHKGRYAGPVWQLFIDAFALVCGVSSLTGLAVLGLHARERARVWPVTGLGVVIPLLLAILLVH